MRRGRRGVAGGMVMETIQPEPVEKAPGMNAAKGHDFFGPRNIPTRFEGGILITAFNLTLAHARVRRAVPCPPRLPIHGGGFTTTARTESAPPIPNLPGIAIKSEKARLPSGIRLMPYALLPNAQGSRRGPGRITLSIRPERRCANPPGCRQNGDLGQVALVARGDLRDTLGKCGR